MSEKETADRNYALAYYMREHNCFPERLNFQETLDLYFQVFSIFNSETILENFFKS